MFLKYKSSKIFEKRRKVFCTNKNMQQAKYVNFEYFLSPAAIPSSNPTHAKQI